MAFFPYVQFQIATVPFGYPDLTINIVIEMNRSILRRLSRTPHLFEKRIRRFRIGHARLAYS